MIKTTHFVRILTIFCLLFSQASFAYMEVTLLGTGTPRPDINRFGPATLVEIKGQYFLFDAGRGVSMRLQQAGVSLDRINTVFFTHLHSDHITGLSDVWLTSWIWQRQQPLSIIGPTGTNAFTEHLQQAYQADYQYRHQNTGLPSSTFVLDSQEIETDQIVYDKDGIVITAFLVDHHPVDPAFGYKIEYGNESIVISGDTTYTDNLIRYAKDANLLIHEIAAADETLLERNPRLNKVLSYHTTPMQAVDILNKTQPKATVFTHILLFGIGEKTVQQLIEQHYSGELRIGHDLMKIGVGEKTIFR